MAAAIAVAAVAGGVWLKSDQDDGAPTADRRPGVATGTTSGDEVVPPPTVATTTTIPPDQTARVGLETFCDTDPPAPLSAAAPYDGTAGRVHPLWYPRGRGALPAGWVATNADAATVELVVCHRPVEGTEEAGETCRYQNGHVIQIMTRVYDMNLYSATTGSLVDVAQARNQGGACPVGVVGDPSKPTTIAPATIFNLPDADDVEAFVQAFVAPG